MKNNSTYLNILISKFNKTVDEIKEKQEKKEYYEEFLQDNVCSLGHEYRLRRDLLEYEVIKLKARRDTLKELITELKENEENE